MTAAHPYCTFFLGDLFLGVEVQKVQEVLRFRHMTPVPLASPVIRGLINLRGQIVPALDMRIRFEMPPRPTDQPPMNVVVGAKNGVVSLLVDDIGEVQSVSEDAFEPTPATVGGVTRELVRGVFKLEKRLLLLLDLEKTVTLLKAKERAP